MYEYYIAIWDGWLKSAVIIPKCFFFAIVQVKLWVNGSSIVNLGTMQSNQQKTSGQNKLTNINTHIFTAVAKRSGDEVLVVIFRWAATVFLDSFNLQLFISDALAPVVQQGAAAQEAFYNFVWMFFIPCTSCCPSHFLVLTRGCATVASSVTVFGFYTFCCISICWVGLDWLWPSPFISYTELFCCCHR